MVETGQKYSSFEDMPVWQLAKEIALYTYQLTKDYPADERYGLISDTRRAAVSISANIAEAYGRFHYKDKLNFYYNSRGSVTEVLSHLKIAKELKYIASSDIDKAEQKIKVVWEELNKIINTLRKK